MLGFEGVVVPYYAACFGPEFVRRCCQLGEEAEFRTQRHYVQDVAVVVECIEAVGVVVEELGEDGFGFVEF